MKTKTANCNEDIVKKANAVRTASSLPMRQPTNDLAENSPFVVVIDDAVLPEEMAERVRAVSPRIELIEKSSPDALRKAHVIYTASAGFDLADAPCLQWVQTESAAIAHLINTPLGRSGLPVANVRGAFSASVAEMAVGMLLILTRRLNLCESLRTRGSWPEGHERLQYQGDGCYDRTLGILGYGSLGRQVARIAKGMGMEILAMNRQGKRTRYEGFGLPDVGDLNGDLPEQWYGPDQLEGMLSRCKAVVLTLPLTDRTYHMIGKRELESLPEHAYVIDVGRGGVLDLEALCVCLESGGLDGAALDVFETEPLPTESPLWRLPNVIISPHIGAGTKRRQHLAGEVLVENISRFLDRRPLINLVDFARGY